MDAINARRSFFKHLLSLLVFSSGSIFSFKRNTGTKIYNPGPVKAHAMGSSDRRIRKIAIEEAAGIGLEEQIEERLRDMDEAGIDMQVLSATVHAGDQRTPSEATATAVETNNSFARVMERYPDRFSAFADIPLQDPDAAAREMERAVTQLGFKGAMIFGLNDGTFLDDPQYWVILETAERLDMPIYLHPNVPPANMIGPYLKYPILSRSMWGFAAQSGLHAMRMILGGVFERYPRLRIILGHLGENIPLQMWRIDNRWMREKDGLGGSIGADPSVVNMKKLPSEYFKEHFYVTTSGMFWEPALQLVHTAIGPDRILFAVDYNQESNVVAADFIESVNLSDEDKEKICHGNAERLLKL
ncbi:amidohydrolase family protein [Deltaproteobacteria bacterium]|nr:amidohydrolase family protein [Deltaproteobacteria bacterium]